jgi:hypothetical protein
MNALKNSWKTPLIGLAGGAFYLLTHGFSLKQVTAIVCKDFNISNVPTLPEGK